MALATGRAPGLAIDEEELLEARWLIQNVDQPAQVVNVSFGAEIHLYVFDRGSGGITIDRVIGINDIAPSSQIADVINETVQAANG